MQKNLIRIVSGLLAALLPYLGWGAWMKDAGAPYEAQDAQNVRLYAVVVSDLHTNGWLPHSRNKKLVQLFGGVAKNGTPIDALVLPGDLTEQSLSAEYAFLYTALNETLLPTRVIPATGNHDIRGMLSVPDFKRAMRGYYTFCGSVGVQTDRPYFSETVKDYTFIVLGSEQEVKDSAYISPAQLLWLDETLAAARNSGKPVFLVCHQPLAHRNNVDKVWPDAGTLGEQSDDVSAILQKHAEAGLPIVYISGHLHQTFGQYSFESPCRNLYCLNLPSAQYNDGGGEGVVLEAYDDQILLRARNFTTGEWLPEVYTVPLTGADAP